MRGERVDDLEYFAFLASNVPAGDLARAAAKKLARKASQTLTRKAARRVPAPLQIFCARDASDLALKLAAPRASLLWADSSQRNQVREAAEKVPGAVARVLRRAQAAWRRELDVFGTRVRFGRKAPVDWHLDALRGERFDPRTGSQEPSLLRPGLDPKAPWAIARFEQGLALAQGVWLSDSDEDRARYANEFASQVRSFAKENPPGVGINWTSPMEAALRAANLSLAFLMMRHRPELQEPQFALCFAELLLAHGRFVEAHLEDTGAVPNNHFVANLAGLLHLATIFPELPSAKAWRQTAVDGLRQQIERQVLADGFTFEGSVGYHRLALELFTLALLAARATRIDLGESYRRRLHLMFRAVRTYLAPSGRAPQLGDNDSGRALPLCAREPLDHGYLLSLGAALFEDPELKPEGDRFCDEGIFLLGAEGLRRWQALPETGPRLSGSLPKAGLFFLRSASAYCAVSCGPNGQGGVGGHSHNDKLSIEIHAGGRPLIVDPGTGCYTSEPAVRDQFRSTAWHSTVEVDGLEQNRFPESRLFALPDQARARALAFESSPGRERFVGEHRGYERLSPPLRHRREVFFHRAAKAFFISDLLEGSGKHQLVSRLQLPDRGARLRAPTAAELGRLARLAELGRLGTEQAIELVSGGRPAALILGDARGALSLAPRLYSAGYGMRRESSCVELAYLGELPLSLCVAILLL